MNKFVIAIVVALALLAVVVRADSIDSAESKSHDDIPAAIQAKLARADKLMAQARTLMVKANAVEATTRKSHSHKSFFGVSKSHSATAKKSASASKKSAAAASSKKSASKGKRSAGGKGKRGFFLKKRTSHRKHKMSYQTYITLKTRYIHQLEVRRAKRQNEQDVHASAGRIAYINRKIAKTEQRLKDLDATYFSTENGSNGDSDSASAHSSKKAVAVKKFAAKKAQAVKKFASKKAQSVKKFASKQARAVKQFAAKTAAAVKKFAATHSAAAVKKFAAKKAAAVKKFASKQARAVKKFASKKAAAKAAKVAAHAAGKSVVKSVVSAKKSELHAVSNTLTNVDARLNKLTRALSDFDDDEEEDDVTDFHAAIRSAVKEAVQ